VSFLKRTLNSIENCNGVLLGSRDVTPDSTERISTPFAPERARYLLLNFHNSDIPLCQVVVKWNPRSLRWSK